MDQALLDRLIEFRHSMHSSPELSGSEQRTNLAILNYLATLHADELVPNIGGFGIAATFMGTGPGRRVLVRGDMDALPISEDSDLDYRSSNPNIAHLCGHDGHTTVLLGLAEMLSRSKPQRGEIVLLFQPAEETGKGAKKVIDDPRFIRIQPEIALGMHNLPGYELGKIVINRPDQSFASASTGLVLKLHGRTSHAAEPERGISPVIPTAKIIQRLTELPKNLEFFSLLTIIHVRIGDVAFGTSPGDAEILATLRAHNNETLEKLLELTRTEIDKIIYGTGLESSITLVEPFPATVNDENLREILIKTFKDEPISLLDEPFRWSEDFGYFNNCCPSLFFGLGAGKDHPALHNPEYDFPDSLIPRGVEIFHRLIGELV